MLCIYAYMYVCVCVKYCQKLSWVLLSQQAFKTENEIILRARCLPEIPLIPKLQNLPNHFLVEEGRPPPTHDLQGVDKQSWQFWTACISIYCTVWQSTQPNQNDFRNLP